MKFAIVAAVTFFLGLTNAAHPQNCCAPAVPQQGVLGETAALPHTLDIGLHYQHLRSRGMYDGSNETDNPTNKKADWSQATLTMAYGVLRSLTVSAVVPYIWKNKTRRDVEELADGVSDIVCIVRFSPLTRSFVNYRELSLGLGLKIPTGATDRRVEGWKLSEEMQPGTGSWDYHGSVSYYQGFELVDFVISATYVMTNEHDGYEFGNQFMYLLASDFHVSERLSLSPALSGIVRANDRDLGEEQRWTGRHQLWFIPGVKFQAIPGVLGLQAYFEYPIYQHFNGIQLGSDFNFRLTATCSLPLKRSDEDDE
jgi:hypothetical protein